jgi:hypothetical protein
MSVLQFNPEHCIRQGFKNIALNYYCILFWHITTSAVYFTVSTSQPFFVTAIVCSK